jgi:HSP20 family protein
MAESRSPQAGRAFVETEKEVRRLFQELIHQSWGSGSSAATSAWQPCVDMWETDDALIVEIELPGVKRKDVAVEVDGDRLRITGERRTSVTRGGRHYYQMERTSGRFTRQLRLPRDADRDAIQARFRAGILTLTIPKQNPSSSGSASSRAAPRH